RPGQDRQRRAAVDQQRQAGVLGAAVWGPLAKARAAADRAWTGLARPPSEARQRAGRIRGDGDRPAELALADHLWIHAGERARNQSQDRGREARGLGWGGRSGSRSHARGQSTAQSSSLESL